MTARKRKRTEWGDVKAGAIALARAEGVPAAVERYGMSRGTLSSWLSRQDGAERPSEAISDDVTTPADPLDVDAWIELQRLTERKYRQALHKGDGLAASRLSKSLKDM